jgi:hypothetical protein
MFAVALLQKTTSYLERGNMPESKTDKTIWEIVISAAVALGLDVAFKKFTAASLDKVIELGKLKLQREEQIACKRREILEDFRIMEQADPDTVKNLWRRYEEADVALRENRFIQLLGEIEKDPTLGRRPTLRFLNGLDDCRFWLALKLLEHNWFMEWFQRVRINGGRIAKHDLQVLSDGIAKTFTRSTEILDNMAGWLAPLAGQLADWLE